MVGSLLERIAGVKPNSEVRLYAKPIHSHEAYESRNIPRTYRLRASVKTEEALRSVSLAILQWSEGKQLRDQSHPDHDKLPSGSDNSRWVTMDLGNGDSVIIEVLTDEMREFLENPFESIRLQIDSSEEKISPDENILVRVLGA